MAMKIRTLGRHLREGVKNVGRNGWMTFASIVSVSITLFILGLLIIIAFNVDHMASNVERDVEIRALVDDKATERELNIIQQQIASIPEVEHIQFVSRDDALIEFIAGMGDEGRHFEEFKDDNPLPHAFIIKMYEPQDTPEVAQQVEAIDQVYKVNYGGETIEVLFRLTETMRNVGIVLIIGLAFTAMLLISNTVKMTISARKTEIEIMKLVGATNNFVRWPFFVEGFILGVIGAIIPIVVLALGYHQLLSIAYGQISMSFIEFLPMYPLLLQVALLLLGIGAVIGSWGSFMSVRKFLKV